MAAMKEQTRKVLECVKENEGATAKEIAEILGIAAPSVNGSFTSFVKKGWGYREVELIPGGKVSHLYLTDEGKALDLDALCQDEEA